MQTYFFISLAVVLISYIAMIAVMVNTITRANVTITRIYTCFGLSVLSTLSSLSTIGFGIAWIVEYYNATH